MSFADSSETLVSVVAESAWGTTPATPPFKKVRFTGESLNYNIENVTSNEIRPDRQVSDLIQVGGSASGDLQFELSYDAALQDLLAAALAGDWTGDVLKAGVVKKAFTFEKKFETGATDQYHRFTGCRVGQLQLNIQAKQIATGSFSIMGKGAVTATAAIAGATYEDPGTEPVMAAADVASITIGGIATPLFFTTMNLSLNNNLRAQDAIGQIDTAGIGYGRCEVTAQVTAYFENGSLYSQFVAGTPTSLGFSVSDGANSYEIELPNLKWTSGNVTAGGNNQDVFVELNAQALFDPTEGTALIITRVPAP